MGGLAGKANPIDVWSDHKVCAGIDLLERHKLLTEFKDVCKKGSPKQKEDSARNLLAACTPDPPASDTHNDSVQTRKRTVSFNGVQPAPRTHILDGVIYHSPGQKF